MSRRKYAQANLAKSPATRLNEVRLHTNPAPQASARIPSQSGWSFVEIKHDLLVILRRHQNWIAGSVGAAVLIACLFLIVREPTYTSTATVQPILSNESVLGTAEPTPAVDVASLVKSQTYRLQSPELSRRVIDRMVNEPKPGTRLSKLYPSIFKGFDDTSLPTGQELDIANDRLMSRLRVWNEQRTYIIVASYSAATPEEAARVVNLVVAEYEHTNRVQTFAAQQSSAQLAVTKLEGKYGPKHPLMTRAVADLVTARSRLDAAEKAPSMAERELFETGEIVPARAMTIPTGLGKRYILLSAVMVSLLLALVALFVIEYRAFEQAVLRHIRLPQ